MLNEIEEVKKKIQQLEEQLKKAEADETQHLLAEIKKTEEGLARKQEQLRRHIRKEIELRDNPILDSPQETIKRSKIYSGELIINGGPGTGKTTTLVQRISYLTQNFEAIVEDVKRFQEEYGMTDTIIPNLTKEDFDTINNDKKSWIFFTPSELLRAYLTNAMSREGLKATRETVTTWDNHRKNLMRSTGLFDSSKNTAFKNKQSDFSFYKIDVDNFLKLDRTFKDFYWGEIRKLIEKAKTIDIKNTTWALTGGAIQKDIEKAPSGRDLKEWIRLFVGLERKFKDKTNNLLTDLKETLDFCATKTLNKLSKSKAGDYQVLIEMIKNDSKSNIDEDEDEIDINEEIFDDNDITTNEEKVILQRKIRSLLRKISLKRFDSKTKYSSKDRKYITILQPSIDACLTNNDLDNIGEGVLYGKYFAKLTRGVLSNIIRPIKPNYKKFRRQKILIEPLLTAYGKLALPDLLTDKTARNTRIHKDEQDYILYFVFSSIRGIYKFDRTIYKDSINRNSFIATFDTYMRAMVAVDEATDFSIFELAVMRQLTYPKFNSITLSGDIMQRMESKGIESWANFKKVFNTAEVENLTISYRQTPILLDIAKTIYESSTGNTPNFKSYTDPSEENAAPLLFINDNFEEKVEWLVNRILEINKLYDNIFPTIAIFVKDDQMAIKLADYLNNVELLEDEDMNAVACTKGKILGDKNSIRIFDIQYIKGLEFESVFFMDIDDLDVKHKDLIDKYIYVGISRATFFLGVTANKAIPKKFQKIERHFTENGQWIN